MTPEQLVHGLLVSVVNENVALYRDMFSQTNPDKASDPYWIRALALFGTLSEKQREAFLEVLRQIAVDTTSNILGVIDGVSYIEGADGGFELRHGARKINGDLQSLFLAEEERRTKY